MSYLYQRYKYLCQLLSFHLIKRYHWFQANKLWRNNGFKVNSQQFINASDCYLHLHTLRCKNMEEGKGGYHWKLKMWRSDGNNGYLPTLFPGLQTHLSFLLRDFFCLLFLSVDSPSSLDLWFKCGLLLPHPICRHMGISHWWVFIHRILANYSHVSTTRLSNSLHNPVNMKYIRAYHVSCYITLLFLCIDF